MAVLSSFSLYAKTSPHFWDVRVLRLRTLWERQRGSSVISLHSRSRCQIPREADLLAWSSLCFFFSAFSCVTFFSFGAAAIPPQQRIIPGSLLRDSRANFGDTSHKEMTVRVFCYLRYIIAQSGSEKLFSHQSRAL